MPSEVPSLSVWIADPTAPPVRIPIDVLAPYMSGWRPPQPFKRLVIRRFESLSAFATSIGVARPRLSREANRRMPVSIRVQRAVRDAFPDLTDAELFFEDDLVDAAGRRPRAK